MICKHPGNPLLHKGIVGMRFFAFLGKFVSLAADKVKYGSVQPEGVKGAIADFVCFLRPLSRPQTQNPLQ